MTEQQLQAQFYRQICTMYPELHRLLWAIPNDALSGIESQQGYRRAQDLKATGLLGGVWDLGIMWEKQYHVIETKLPGNTLTKDRIEIIKGQPVKKYGQLEWGRLMAAQGAMRHIYHSLDEGLSIASGIMAGIASDGTFMKASEM